MPGISRNPLTLFPAWAGVILDEMLAFPSRSAIPRMGGGDPSLPWIDKRTWLYSPHGRG